MIVVINGFKRSNMLKLKRPLGNVIHASGISQNGYLFICLAPIDPSTHRPIDRTPGTGVGGFLHGTVPPHNLTPGSNCLVDDIFCKVLGFNWLHFLPMSVDDVLHNNQGCWGKCLNTSSIIVIQQAMLSIAPID